MTVDAPHARAEITVSRITVRWLRGNITGVGFMGVSECTEGQTPVFRSQTVRGRIGFEKTTVLTRVG